MEQHVPIIEIAFRNEMWWSLPASMSKELYEKYIAREQDIGYVWDWGALRYGSWCPDGEKNIAQSIFARLRQHDANKHRQ